MRINCECGLFLFTDINTSCLFYYTDGLLGLDATTNDWKNNFLKTKCLAKSSKGCSSCPAPLNLSPSDL